MSIYAVILEKESQPVHDLIHENYPGNYEINTPCFLVRTDELSDKVAHNVGIKSGQETPPGGVVLKLNGAYSGLAASSLWEWLAIEE